MHSSIDIRIAAPGQVVFDLARQVDRWADLLPHYRKVTVRSRDGERIEARMQAIRRFGPIPFPVTWRAVCWPEGADPEDLRLRFRHVWGVTKGMDVTWHIRPDGDGCHVSIEHVFSRRLPLLGDQALPRFVDRWFTVHVAGRTLRRFKALAEGTASATAPGTKGPA
jgi:ribosome-associated toxin RatA of RatAB toxin-antitoxin module